ncbi:hypothetical protein RN001_015945 [Aquatica leii]|uniref:14-3-3 domain-containing protein n=1 Tax=Aquatica leii TaxID=1421715 RepID=A0AAN7P136_9COLE|nr:hypothetical protein RN001_015945 [Aquatica leii]
MELVEAKDSASYFILRAKKDFDHLRLEDARINMFCYIQDRRRLGPSERELFYHIFKYRIKDCRISIDNLTKGYSRYVTSKPNKELLKESISKLKKEIQTICILTESIIQNELLPYTFNYEARIFYTSTQGDCFRIMSQILPNEVTDVDKKMGFCAYHCAYHFAIDTLGPTDELRVSTGLKFALYYCTTLMNKKTAKKIYIKVIDSAKQMWQNNKTKAMIAKSTEDPVGNNVTSAAAGLDITDLFVPQCKCNETKDALLNEISKVQNAIDYNRRLIEQFITQMKREWDTIKIQVMSFNGQQKQQIDPLNSVFDELLPLTSIEDITICSELLEEGEKEKLFISKLSMIGESDEEEEEIEWHSDASSDNFVPELDPTLFEELDRDPQIADYVLVEFPNNEDIAFTKKKDIKMILLKPINYGTTKRQNSYYSFEIKFNLNI